MKSLTIILIVFIFIGCTKVTDVVIPSDMSTWDKELTPAIKKLSAEDRKLFSAYVVRAKLAGMLTKENQSIPIGMTIGDAILEEKKRLADQEKQAAEAAALKAKIEAEHVAISKAIHEVTTVTLLKKAELISNYHVGRFSDYQQFKIGIKNKSDKEIVGISGELEFIDIFEKTVGSVSFKISEKIKPNETYVWLGGRDYNRFIDSHRSVWNLDEGKFTTRFIPIAVVFSDGTKLIAPE